MMKKRRNAKQAGFSLVELMVVVAILTVVFGIVVSGIADLQRRSSAENSKVDMTQAMRDFVDQSVRDIHQAGYPSYKMYNAGTAFTPVSSTSDPYYNFQNGLAENTQVAAGLVSVSSSSIHFEADTDGTGVKEEYIQLASSTCPCTLQRGVVAKVASPPTSGQSTPSYYSELSNVTNNNIFKAYDGTGAAVTLPVDISTTTGQTTMKTIRTIEMTVNVQSPNKDLTTKVAPTASVTASARIENY
jgi:prepilin-type N-terminal cleavage/methylation domain-containing protein